MVDPDLNTRLTAKESYDIFMELIKKHDITKEMKIVGIIKRKGILGSFFKTIERDDADLLKVINKRIKLENPIIITAPIWKK